MPAALLELHRHRLDVFHVDLVADLELVEILDLRTGGDVEQVALRTLERHVTLGLVDGGDGSRDIEGLHHPHFAGPGVHDRSAALRGGRRIRDDDGSDGERGRYQRLESLEHL
jgi:hypothetical protein